MTQFHRHRTGIIRKRNPTPKLNEDEPEVRKRKVSRLRHLAAEAATRLNLTASIALESILTVCVDVFEQWTLPLGQVQLLSCYDSRAHILYVTILRARKLQTRRPNGDARPDPLVRCILLPGQLAKFPFHFHNPIDIILYYIYIIVIYIYILRLKRNGSGRKENKNGQHQPLNLQHGAFAACCHLSTARPTKHPNSHSGILTRLLYCFAGRQAENERRTRFLSLTSDPEWHQTMVYPAVTPAELHKRQLEVTVWHHQYDGTLEFLGEFLLDLTSNPLNLRLSPTIFP